MARGRTLCSPFFMGIRPPYAIAPLQMPHGKSNIVHQRFNRLVRAADNSLGCRSCLS